MKGAKQWRVRLNRPTNQEVSIFVQNALKDLAAFLERELILSIEASCKVQFGFNLTSATNQTKISELFPDYFQENILQITGLVRRGKACDEGDESLQNQNCISIQINEFTADGWTQSLLWWAIFCFVAIFSYIGPWVVCLFPATEVSYRPNRLGEDRLIIVNLQSPVGLRSLIGNFFFSADDMMGNRVKRFIMRIFILPVLFFLPALFVEYLQYNDILPRYNFLHISHLFSSVQLLCYCCYCLQAFLCSFSIGKPGIWSLLPLQMLIHFRTIYYFLKRWMLGIRFYIFMALCIIIDFSTHRTVSEIMMRLCGLCLLILFAPIMVYDWLVLFFVYPFQWLLYAVLNTSAFPVIATIILMIGFHSRVQENIFSSFVFLASQHMEVFLSYALQVSVYCSLLNWQEKFCFVRKISRTLLLLGLWPILCGVATVHLPKDTKNSPGRSVTITKNRQVSIELNHLMDLPTL